MTLGEGENGACEGVLKGDESRRSSVDVGTQDAVTLDVREGEVVAVGGSDGDGEGTRE